MVEGDPTKIILLNKPVKRKRKRRPQTFTWLEEDLRLAGGNEVDKSLREGSSMADHGSQKAVGDVR